MEIDSRPALAMTRQVLPGHVAELDGIRGIAVLAVVAFHFGGPIPPHSNWIRIILGSITGMGWLGVSLFFVLSGFLITGILLKTKQSKNYLKSFYIRRALRILPLYYFSVFLFFDVVLPLSKRYFPNNNTVHAWAAACGPFEQLWYWFHLSNFRSAFGVLVASPVGHLWSLACEEQFYFIWPWIVLLLSETALSRFCVITIASCIGFRFLPIVQTLMASNPDIGRLTPFSAEALLVGAILAIGLTHFRFAEIAKRWSPLGFFLGSFGLLLAVVFSGSTNFSSGLLPAFGMTSAEAAFFSAIAYGALNRGRSSLAAIVLRSRVLTQCGKYSYAMYIFQTPIRYVLLIPPIRHRLTTLGEFTASILSILIGIAASYGIARCSWKLIEQPFLKLKDRFAAEPAVAPIPSTAA
jgi:peptidoglycan/LPS O-acetylase OafA/YrhL